MNELRLSCGHREYRDGHCAEMVCSNYIQRCPRHGVAGKKSDFCLNEPKEDWVRVARSFLDIWLSFLGPVDDLDPKTEIDVLHEFEEAAPGWHVTLWQGNNAEGFQPSVLGNDDLIAMFTDEEQRYFVYYEASEDAPFWLIGQYSVLGLGTGMIPIYHIDDYKRKEEAAKLH
jgi:hypothetical protein